MQPSPEIHAYDSTLLYGFNIVIGDDVKFLLIITVN